MGKILKIGMTFMFIIITGFFLIKGMEDNRVVKPESFSEIVLKNFNGMSFKKLTIDYSLADEYRETMNQDKIKECLDYFSSLQLVKAEEMTKTSVDDYFRFVTTDEKKTLGCG